MNPRKCVSKYIFCSSYGSSSSDTDSKLHVFVIEGERRAGLVENETVAVFNGGSSPSGMSEASECNLIPEASLSSRT